MKPVVFLVFNRPEQTALVFERIRAVRPKQLLVVADGPRPGREDDATNCAKVRQLIENGIDWPCDMSTDFAKENLGCGRRVSSGITWAFEHVEEAIIVEDDCLPEPTFFPFCDELLDRFRDDERIMMISGDNFQSGRKNTPYSYYFSRYPHIWGWASWRRAWKHYDFEMRLWPAIRDCELLRSILPEHGAFRRWQKLFQRKYEGEIDTWDHQWTFACWRNNGLAILPSHNLISNIGFDDAATHTRSENALAALPTVPLMFPLSHPPYVLRNVDCDGFTEGLADKGPLLNRLQRRCRRFLDGQSKRP